MTKAARLAVLALALSGCAYEASAPPAPLPPAPAAMAASERLTGAACIDHDQNANWIALDEQTLLVRSAGRAWRVNTNRCPRIDDPLVRLTRVFPGGGSRICSRSDVRLYVSEGAASIPVPCYIQSIQPLTPAEATALEASGRR
jgi:hypothetical protein